MENLKNGLSALAKVRDNLFGRDTPHDSCIELQRKLEYIVTDPVLSKRLGPFYKLDGPLSLFDPIISRRTEYDTKCAELHQFINETNKNGPINFMIPERDTVRHILSGYSSDDGKVLCYMY